MTSELEAARAKLKRLATERDELRRALAAANKDLQQAQQENAELEARIIETTTALATSGHQSKPPPAADRDDPWAKTGRQPGRHFNERNAFVPDDGEDFTTEIWAHDPHASDLPPAATAIFDPATLERPPRPADAFRSPPPPPREKDRLAQELDELRDERRQLRQRLEALETRNAALIQTSQKERTRQRQASVEAARLQQRVDELEAALASRTHEAEAIEARANAAIRSLEDQLSQLRAALEAASGDTDDPAAVKSAFDPLNDDAPASAALSLETDSSDAATLFQLDISGLERQEPDLDDGQEPDDEDLATLYDDALLIDED